MAVVVVVAVAGDLPSTAPARLLVRLLPPMIRLMEALLDRARREQAEWESLRSKVREALPGLVAVLVREYGVRRVTLFGSILRSTPSQRPDIDLLVEGLDASRRAEALGRLFLLAPLPVDLVPRELGRREIVQRALEDGEILYAA